MIQRDDISDKIDFKTKAVKRDKEGHYIMIKGLIQEEDLTIITIYAPNIGPSRADNGDEPVPSVRASVVGGNMLH